LTKTGGWPLTLLEDITQVQLMWKLRVKIDSWSTGVDEPIRQRNRELLTSAYLRCPPRRVWLYVKIVKDWRWSSEGERDPKQIEADFENKTLPSGEDAIANGLTSKISTYRTDHYTDTIV
jgi:hypothetical protein